MGAIGSLHHRNDRHKAVDALAGFEIAVGSL
jgi:hypothetical protein